MISEKPMIKSDRLSRTEAAEVWQISILPFRSRAVAEWLVDAAARAVDGASDRSLTPFPVYGCG